MTEARTSGNVIAMAKRHGIQAQQIYRWRERLELRPTPTAFLPLSVVPGSSTVSASLRRRSVRKRFSEHLTRERVLIAAPTSCPCCGSLKLSKLGEDVTETLEVIPRFWKVIQTVREKFTCRQCEAITQPPAPFHVLPRSFVRPVTSALCWSHARCGFFELADPAARARCGARPCGQTHAGRTAPAPRGSSARVGRRVILDPRRHEELDPSRA
ncbi:hypothetical protein AEGHOMDF_0409 [Methylobacterium soli]|nr:hypothetical protein AEGHOMDF_0409 [Methylobacterium soli]